MAELPAIRSQTVSAIYAAYEAANEQFDSNGLPMSALGTECDRALWFTFRWLSKLEPINGQKLRRFRTGDAEEIRLLDDLRRAGVEVVDKDPATGRQCKVYALGGHVRGKLDGLAIGIPEAPKTWHVVECKSHNEKSFKEIVKKGVQVAKPGHYAQCQLYMHFAYSGFERALYLAVNKNTDELYAERLHYDQVFVLALLARLERVIGAERAPGRIAEEPSKWPCILCEHKAVCFGESFGRQHCRSCLHSGPSIDDTTEARWHCVRHKKDLTLDEQRAGCPNHLFLPEAVPGEQIDASEEGEFVDYQLKDGSVWRDGQKGREA